MTHMLELNPENTPAYLQQQGRASLPMTVEALAWGVSNVVLMVRPQSGAAFVVKQSRAQLRTKVEWFSRLDRIWREVGMLRLLEPLLPAGVIPAVLFEDRDNYLFGMEAAAPDHLVWKQALLEGTVEPDVAATLGDFLAIVHRETAGREDLQEAWGDTEVFVQLRVDPFYRSIARMFPDAATPVNQMVDEMFATPACIVLADFSPKNVLVHRTGAGGSAAPVAPASRVTLLDFETGHYGDPAFDLGFFLSHLLLKAVWSGPRFQEYAGLTRVFWERYQAGLGEPLSQRGPFESAALLRRTLAHLATCMWARVDGTSPVDYLTDPARRAAVREFCQGVLHDPPQSWEDTLARAAGCAVARHEF